MAWNNVPLENLKQVLAGSIVLAQSPKILQILGMGSCIGIIFYSPEKKLGGIAHVMLPSSKQALTPKLKGKYADTAIEELLRRFKKEQIAPKKIIVKIVGGSSMFPQRRKDMFDIATRNVEAVKDILEKKKLSIKGESTGGTKGRSLLFFLDSGEVQVFRAGGKLIKTI